MGKILKYLYSGSVLLVALICWCIHTLPDGLLHVYYLNIGQGDSILIHTPQDQYILVDGGPDDTVLNELGAVMPFYRRKIDLMILSHPHADHINGLVAVLERYEVGSVIMTGVNYHYAGYDKFLNLIHDHHIPVSFALSKNDYNLGSIVMDVVYPIHSFQGTSMENLNNSSIVFRLLYGKQQWYFGGDLEMEGEAILLASGQNLTAQVYKASHHGSRTSSTEPLLQAINPQYAIISCGIDNKFHHPHPETIKKFQEHHITTYRTDLDGRVEIVGDGEKIMVKS